MTTTTTTTCRHCGRAIVRTDGAWIDPHATGDDAVWRETCDAHDTLTADHEPATTYRFRLVCDDDGIDVGDWLAQDRAHYERVGPYRGNPDDWTDQDAANFRDLTWEEWSARPDADADEWASFYMVAERRCDCCGQWERGPSLGGVDYLGYPHCHALGTFPPEPGTYDYDDLPDDDLRGLADELIGEWEATP